MTAVESQTRSRAAEFRKKLQSKIVITDGAMGTMLYGKGVFINRCFDELNLSSPQLVKDVHQEYVKAGAEVIESNTFGANRIRLGAFGFAERLDAIVHAGVKLAREAAGEKAFVAGAIGPLGAQIEPLGALSFIQAREAFKEQADALVAAGVDLLLLETFYDLNELREAISAAREAAGAEMIIVAQVTVNDDGSSARRDQYGNVHETSSGMAGGRGGSELLRGSEGGSRDDRKNGALHDQAVERYAECGSTGDGRRAKYLSLLARVHGAVFTAFRSGWSPADGRLLRHDARTHQANFE